MRIHKQFFLAEAGYGITHIEELPLESFIRLLKKLDDLKAVQKLDGANLLMGVDRDGKLYTSREQKGGRRFYKVTDYPIHSAFDGFRSAHAAFLDVAKQVKAIVPAGTAVNCEILYGEQPNTVIYGKDNLNYIAFLEPVEGDNPTLKLDPELPSKLYAALKGEQVTVQTKVSNTTDGKNITRAEQSSKWGFSKSEVVEPETLDQANIGADLSSLEKFLSKTNADAEDLGFDLTNFEVLKHRSTKLKQLKDKLQEKVLSKYVMPIKRKLLKVVGTLSPSLRTSDASAQGGYDGIEGIILTDPDTNEQFKVVDKDVFTSVNKFNYEVRNKLTGRILTAKDDADLKAKGGIVGNAKIRCIRVLGIKGAEVPSQAKKVLEPFVKADKTGTITAIVNSMNDMHFETVKRKLTAVLTSTLVDLDDELEAFKKSVDQKVLKLDNGDKIKYTPEIRRRTLMTFAESIKNVNDMLQDIRRCKDMTAVIELFFGDIIAELLKDPT
jgi:hypothetical protein